MFTISDLEKLGADGLCGENCGCGIDNLRPCDFDPLDSKKEDCVPAKHRECDSCDQSGRCERDARIYGEGCYYPIDMEILDDNY